MKSFILMVMTALATAAYAQETTVQWDPIEGRVDALHLGKWIALVLAVNIAIVTVSVLQWGKLHIFLSIVGMATTALWLADWLLSDFSSRYTPAALAIALLFFWVLWPSKSPSQKIA